MTMTANAWTTNVWTSQNHTIVLNGATAASANNVTSRIDVDIRVGGTVTAQVEVQFGLASAFSNDCSVNNNASGYGTVYQTLDSGEGTYIQYLNTIWETRSCYDYKSNGQEEWVINGGTKSKYFPNGGLFTLWTRSTNSHSANHLIIVFATPKVTLSN